MVDRVDRPEAAPHYRINAAKDAKENQHQQQNPKEDLERRYQKELAEEKWQKFDRKTVAIRPYRAPKETVERCLFISVNMHGGLVILRADIHWKDGKKTLGVFIILNSLQDFVALRKFKVGQDVPEIYWVRGNYIEMGIAEAPTRAPTHEQLSKLNTSDTQATSASGHDLLITLGIRNKGNRRINTGIIIIYCIIFLTIVFLATLIFAL